MKLIIGIGNPGKKYKNNRHNVGFIVLEELANQLRVPGYELNKKFKSLIAQKRADATEMILAKPQTFMNSSGIAVKKLVDYYKINISDLWVIHDDLDIKLGQYKIQFGVGPKLHYGIQSIDKALGTSDYWRVRIGVDNRKVKQVDQVGQVVKVKKVSGEEYVLQAFTVEEKKILSELVDRVVEDLYDRLFRRIGRLR